MRAIPSGGCDGCDGAGAARCGGRGGWTGLRARYPGPSHSQRPGSRENEDEVGGFGEGWWARRGYHSMSQCSATPTTGWDWESGRSDERGFGYAMLPPDRCCGTNEGWVEVGVQVEVQVEPNRAADAGGGDMGDREERV